jgi:predicted TIM-barrel fold metal-dependent hydrolase
MDIVDSQIHLGPGGIEKILGAMDALGIKSALVDEAWIGMGELPCYELNVNGAHFPRQSSPTAELASLTHPDRFSYLLRVDHRDPELRSLIRLMRDTSHCRAIRNTIGVSKDNMKALASGGYDVMFKEAADCGLPIFLTIPGNAPALRAAAEKYKNLIFIIDHCGMPFTEGMKNGMRKMHPGLELPDMGGGTNAQEFDKTLSLADLPNVYMKWGHAQGLFGITGYPYDPLRPFLKSAIKAFGAERVMWCSDISVNQTGDTWAGLLYWIINDPDISQADKANLLGGSVRKALNWPAPK